MKHKTVEIDLQGVKSVEEIINKDTETYTRYEYGEEVESRPATEDELDAFTPHGVSTSKADIWRRATDAEAEAIDALLRDPPPDLGMSPVKLRRLWEDATSIDHTDPLFGTIRAIAVEHFGEERADALLKPSE